MAEEGSVPRADASALGLAQDSKRMMDTLYGNGRPGLIVEFGEIRSAFVLIKDQLADIKTELRKLREQRPVAVARKPMNPAKWAALIVGSPTLLYALARGLKAIAESIISK